MWSFVGNKKQQRWLWYAREARLKRIIAHVFVFLSVGAKRHFANYWGCCQVSMSPDEKHIKGKLYTAD
ncbi:MAG: hypothetical protein RL248_1116 [Pseudomonadota bacterium]